MQLSIVVAMDRGRLIGRDGTLPWHLPDDLRRFRAITMGKPIIMGRRTHDSIGRALPGRRNIVLTRNKHYEAPDCELFSGLSSAIEALADVDEAMIIGGAELYARALPLAGRLYLTAVEANIDGDVRFPDFEPGEWQERSVESHPADDRHAYAFSFRVLERISREPARSMS